LHHIYQLLESKKAPFALSIILFREKKKNQSNVKNKFSISKSENSGPNAQSWQLKLELQHRQKQQPQGRGILSESPPPGVTGGHQLLPEKSQD